MKAVVHQKAGIFDWSESPSSINKQFLVQAKQAIQSYIFEKVHGIKWDFPDATGKGGTTTTGNVARELLHNFSSRSLILEGLSEEQKDLMSTWGTKLSVIIRVFSSSRKVNVEKYKQFCTDLYLFTINNFPRVHNTHLKGPWISITPSLHKLLAYSWSLFQTMK